MELIGLVLGLGAIGLVAGLIGALLAGAGSTSVGGAATSYIQHFAAGLILAAATLDLLPEAEALGGGWPLIIGFALGTAFMLVLRSITQRLGHGHGDGHGHGGGHSAAHTGDPAHAGSVGLRSVNLPLVAALAVVVLIDGLIIGISVVSGGGAATLIAVALAIELLFVTASIAASARGNGASKGTAIGAGAVVSLMFLIGALLGAVLFAGVSATTLVVALGFGAVALIFTAVEELLLEAHEVKESAGTAALGSAGFLTFMLLAMAM